MFCCRFINSIYVFGFGGVGECEGCLYFVDAKSVYAHELADLIRHTYEGKICEHADIENIIAHYPCELAYALALVDTTDYRSITPAWVLRNYPNVENIVRCLRHTICVQG